MALVRARGCSEEVSVCLVQFSSELSISKHQVHMEGQRQFLVLESPEGSRRGLICKVGYLERWRAGACYL